MKPGWRRPGSSARSIHPRFSLTAIVKGTFRVRHGETAMLAEEQLPLTGDTFESEDPSKPLRYPSDFAPFKPRADVLLVGTCYAPGGQARASRTSALQNRHAGEVARRVRRSSLDGRRPANSPDTVYCPSALVGTSVRRRRHSHRNPLGRGFEPSERRDAIDRASATQHRIGRSSTAVAGPTRWSRPASVPFPRLASAGATGRNVRRPIPEGALAVASANMDWGFFNAAPEDQQMEAYLHGDEELYLENLHPSDAAISKPPPRPSGALLPERTGAGA